MSTAGAQSPTAPDVLMEGDSQAESNVSLELGTLQWTDIVAVVRDTGYNLSPEDELNDLAAAEAAVNTKDAERAEVVDKQNDELQELSRQYQLASQAAQRPTNHLSAAEHDAQIRALEEKQYAVGKKLNEDQATIAKREVELGRARAERDEVKQWEVGHEIAKDDEEKRKIIGIKQFHDMGFKLLPSKGSEPIKILIRNDHKPDVHVVTIDDPTRKVHYANLLWGLASPS